MITRYPLAALLFVALLPGASALAAEAPAAPEAADAESEPAFEGLLIDRFMIRDVRPAQGAKLRLSFAIYAEAPAEDADALRAAIERRRHRLRGEVITAVRTTEQHDFQQPGLDRFRRRILLRLLRTNPGLPIERLLIGEFEFFLD